MYFRIQLYDQGSPVISQTAFVLLESIISSLSDGGSRDEFPLRVSRENCERLVFRHYRYLLSLLRFKLRDDPAAEDLLQDALAAFLGSIQTRKPRFASEKALKNYLTTIALNKVRDHFRAHRLSVKRIKTFTRTEDLDGFLENISSKEGNPEEDVLRSERQNDARRAVSLVMERLSPEYREILGLKYVSEKRNSQISEALGISVKAVESRLFRAKTEFRALFEKLLLKENVFDV